MSVNTFLATYQRPSAHIFYSMVATSINDTFDINFNVVFPVKEVKISVGYVAATTNLVNIYAVMNSLLPGNDVLFTLSNHATSDATPRFVYSDSLGSNVVSYIFRESQLITGTYRLNLATINNAAFGALFSANAIIHFECLG